MLKAKLRLKWNQSTLLSNQSTLLSFYFNFIILGVLRVVIFFLIFNVFKMITCHFKISDFVHHLGGKTQKSSECCFLIENGSRFELKVSFLDIYMMNFSLHDFLNIRKGCFKHLSGFYFIITSHCYSDCEYMVGILW